MDALVIAENTKVTFYFSLALETGEEIDSNFEKQPATFTVGDGNLLPGFEKYLMGLAPGAKEIFSVPPEDGFGQPNPNNIQEVSRQSFDGGIELKEGLVVSFSDPAGGELPGVIHSFNDETVKVDFNHPLAGRRITFTVHILDVVPAVTH